MGENKITKQDNNTILNEKDISLLAINYAFQNTINWGGLTWHLTETDLKELKNLIILEDYKKTGYQIWKWFYETWDKKFATTRKMEDIGAEFIKNIYIYTWYK